MPQDLVVEEFDGASRRAQVAITATFALLAVGLFSLIQFVLDDLSAAVRLWISVPLSLPLGLAAWVVARMRLELRTFPDGLAARVRPTRWVRVNSSDVVVAEMVEISPFWEFGGWMDKRNFGDRLLGGRGSVALRMTYRLPDSSQGGQHELKTHRLTLLTEEAQRLLAHLRSSGYVSG